MSRYTRTSRVLALAVVLAVPFSAKAQQPQALGKFIVQTVTLHPAIKAADKALSKARASKSAAGNYPHNPEFEAGYEETAEKTTEFGISQTLDVWDRRGASVSAATAEIDIAAAEYDQTKTELIERLLVAIGENRKQLDLRRLAEKRLSLSARFLNLIRKFQAAGDIGQAEVLSAEVNKSNAELQAAAAQAQVAQAQSGLISLVGENRENWPMPLDVVAAAPNNFKPNLENTPELRLARAVLNATKAGIRIADKGWRPDPTIGVRVGEEGDSTLFGISLSVPIPVWNRGTAEKLAASEDAAGKEFLVVDTMRRLRARLITAEESFDSALAAINRWRRQTVPAMRNQEKLLTRLAEAREIGALEYLQQLNQLIETESLGIDLEQAIWMAWIARLRAGANLNAWVEELK